MNLLTRRIYWVLLNGLILYAVIQATFFQAEGWKNLTMFFLWFYGIAIFLGYIATKNNDKALKELRDKGRSIPGWLSVASDLSIILILAYHGWFWTAAIWWLQMSAEHLIFKDKPAESI